MKKILLLVLLISFGLYEYYKDVYSYVSDNAAPIKQKIHYSCDGREWCSQMTSCEEATFFSHNCSDTMDGDRDGIPCESQWCGH